MRVRLLLQTLLNCDLDSEVEILINQKAVPLKHVLQGGRSLTAYFGTGGLVKDSIRVDVLEQDRQPHPRLGLTLRAEALREVQKLADASAKAPVIPTSVKRRRKR